MRCNASFATITVEGSPLKRLLQERCCQSLAVRSATCDLPTKASCPASVHVTPVTAAGRKLLDEPFAKDAAQRSIDTRGHAGQATGDVDACAVGHVATHFVGHDPQAILHVARSTRLA